MKTMARRLVLTHIPLAALLYLVLFAPKSRPGIASNVSLLVALAIFEGLFLLSVWRKRRTGRSLTAPFDIMTIVWILLFVWELMTTVLNRAHPVLIPAPENVFHTFRVQWSVMLQNIAYSLQLLVIGFFTGLILAVVLGLIAGWYPRLRAFAYPIANVLAPIPAVVFSPYLVALMPTFRSASVVVIVLGVFWPNFLTTVNRVVGIEPQILDSARMLCPSNRTMLWHILLPYLFPGVVSGLRVSLTTSLLMLNFAELMGATRGMGFYVQNSIAYANYAHAIAGIIVIGVVVTALSALVSRLQKHLVRWH